MSARSRRRPPLIWLILLTALGCGTQGPTVPDCTGTVTVSATTGTHPKFTWTPACQLEGVIVALPGPGAVVWYVASPNRSNTIAPSITYGQAPAGGSLITPPVALSTGTPYTVTLFRFDDGHGGSGQSAGSLTFVP